MSQTTFVDKETVIEAEWLNDVDAHVWNAGHRRYVLGTTAAAAQHTGAATGFMIETDYFDTNRTLGSGSKVAYTGTTTAGKAGNWPDADGFFYDADGKQFSFVGDPINLLAFGVDGTGAGDTAALVAALAALPSGGSLYCPGPRTYVIWRGDGSDPYTDNIVSGNVTIYGDGKATLFDGYREDGTVTDNVGNQHYNIFQATSRTGITIRDMSFKGYAGCVSLFSCTDVIISGNYSDGNIGNAGMYLRDKSFYIYECDNVIVEGNTCYDGQFNIYLSGSVGTQSNSIRVRGNHVEHTLAAGAYTTLWPTGVYVHYANEVTITGNTFKNIFSSFDNGNSGTGVGYGIYEGDGSCTSITITGNTFNYEAKGDKRAVGIYVTQSLNSTVVANTIIFESGAHMFKGIWMASQNDLTNRVVSGNTVDGGDYITAQTESCIETKTTSTTNTGSIQIIGNTVRGGFNGITLNTGPMLTYNVTGNSCDSNGRYGILFGNVSDAIPLKYPVVSNNTVTKSGLNGIMFHEYIVSPIVCSNHVFDGNQDNAGSGVYAIRLQTKSIGGTFIGNVMGNIPGNGGNFSGGIAQLGAVAVDRIFKDITFGNSIVGMTGNVYTDFTTLSPTNQIFDAAVGDFIENSRPAIGQSPGWHCIKKTDQVLTADASNGIGTTIKVASTANMLPGDIVLLTKSNDPFVDANWYTATWWHKTTILSITNGTDFVISGAIDAGDGTYSIGTAYCKTTRFASSKQMSPEIVRTLTAAKTLTNADNNSIFRLNNNAGFTITLPALQAGLKFKFFLKAAPTGAAYIIATPGAANIIYGVITTADDAAGDVVTVAAADQINFVVNRAAIGDWCEVVCDGGFWYVSGMCDLFDGMTTST